MDGKNQINSNGELNNSEEFPKNEIPLWLQGLDGLPSDSIDSGSESDWVKEGITVNDPLPEGNIEQDQPEILDIEEPDEEITEFGEHYSDLHSSDLSVNPEETNNEDEPIEEGFIEISESDFGLEQADLPDNPMLPDNEELPEWLHEMITETPESLPEELIPPVMEEIKEIVEAVDEPTEPMDITQETVIKVEEESIELLDEPLLPLDETSVEETTLELSEALEEKPTEFSLESEAGPEEEEKEEEEQQEEQDIPRMLMFAKYLLDEGDTTRAIEIFTSYMGQSLYRNQIKSWLVECAQREDIADSAIWESLGDIAMKEGESEQAFNAYTKSIQILVSFSKDSDEIS